MKVLFERTVTTGIEAPQQGRTEDFLRWNTPLHLCDRVTITGDVCMVRQRDACEPALHSEDDLSSDQRGPPSRPGRRAAPRRTINPTGDVARFQTERSYGIDDLDFEPPWLESQPSALQVLIPRNERATRLAALKQPGPKMDT